MPKAEVRQKSRSLRGRTLRNCQQGFCTTCNPRIELSHHMAIQSTVMTEDSLPPIQEDPDPYIGAVIDMLTADGLHETADFIRECEIKCEETGYDNWNGGTNIFTIWLIVEPRKFASLGIKKSSFEEQINARLKPVYERHSSDWYEVKITPKIQPNTNWRQADRTDVSRAVRQNILDGIKLEGIAWEGTLDEVEFLARIFDLDSMPSTDSRYKTASSDIWQHRINNYDWDQYWIFDDIRFALKTGSGDNFLRFLCEVLHPVVRPDRDQALKLAQQFNEQLRRDGWELVEEERIAGRPKFVAVLATMARRSVTRAKSVADALDAAWMQKEIERLERSVDNDPSLAIGTAKELVETCCKTILTKRQVVFTNSTDLPELVKLLTKELKLVPDDISDQAKGADKIKLLLRNFAAQVQYLAELRSLYGSGHGRDGKHRGLEPRHARLAVGAAVTFIDFITETYRQRENTTTSSPS